MILVLGASGHTGLAVTRALTAAGLPVRGSSAVARNPGPRRRGEGGRGRFLAEEAARGKAEVEDHLYKSDLDFTVLQPARFMHGLLLSSWNRLMTDGVLADAVDPTSAMAYVDYDDVAEVVAQAFTGDRLSRSAFELSAPRQHTLHEVAATLEAMLGRAIRAEQVDIASYGPTQALLGRPPRDVATCAHHLHHHPTEQNARTP